jgi:hypothetical protein
MENASALPSPRFEMLSEKYKSVRDRALNGSSLMRAGTDSEAVQHNRVKVIVLNLWRGGCRKKVGLFSHHSIYVAFA